MTLYIDRHVLSKKKESTKERNINTIISHLAIYTTIITNIDTKV